MNEKHPEFEYASDIELVKMAHQAHEINDMEYRKDVLDELHNRAKMFALRKV